jgi:hypothetical protein
MATKLEGNAKQNASSMTLKGAKTPTTGGVNRGQTKRTMKYEQSVRDNKSASGKDY